MSRPSRGRPRRVSRCFSRGKGNAVLALPILPRLKSGGFQPFLRCSRATYRPHARTPTTAGIVTQLEAAKQTTSDAERERRIDNAKRLARDSLAEARRSVQALRPQALENSRLPEALADEVARWSLTSGVAGEVETTGEARALHPEVEVTLLRVADRTGLLQPGGGVPAVHQRGHGQDPRAARLRQARGQRPGRRCRRRLRAGPAAPSLTRAGQRGARLPRSA